MRKVPFDHGGPLDFNTWQNFLAIACWDTYTSTYLAKQSSIVPSMSVNNGPTDMFRLLHHVVSFYNLIVGDWFESP